MQAFKRSFGPAASGTRRSSWRYEPCSQSNKFTLRRASPEGSRPVKETSPANHTAESKLAKGQNAHNKHSKPDQPDQAAAVRDNAELPSKRGKDISDKLRRDLNKRLHEDGP